jgi:hypothetical protein
MQVDARLLPLPLHGALGDAAHRGDLGEREAAEKFEVDDLGERGVDPRQLVECLADPEKLALVGGAVGRGGVDGGDLNPAAALEGMPAAGVIDDHPAHDPRRVPHEARAVRKLQPVLPRHVDVGLVQQGRGAEALGSAVPGELLPCQPVQLGIKRGEQRIRGLGITLVGRLHQGRYGRFHGSPLSCNTAADRQLPGF